MKTSSIAMLLALLVSAPLQASQCPSLWKKIDAGLATAQLDDARRAEVMELRATGEAQHKDGKHADSVATLDKALEILGAK